jgi:hypothetical protein
MPFDLLYSTGGGTPASVSIGTDDLANEGRTSCYHFATQLGSNRRSGAIRDEPLAPNSLTKQYYVERAVTGRNANNRIRKPLLYPAELRDHRGAI